MFLARVTVVSPANPDGVEDGASIPLTIVAQRSADDDGSEVLSVQITVPSEGGSPAGSIIGATPAGVSLMSQGNGAFQITADGATANDREALLNSFLDGLVVFKPRSNWSGVLSVTGGLKIDVVSTEIAEGVEVHSKSASLTACIGLVVTPDADPATVVVKGNAIRPEDVCLLQKRSFEIYHVPHARSDPSHDFPLQSRIPIPISVGLNDADGSEFYNMTISDNLPAGSTLFGAGGTELVSTDGVIALKQADIAALELLPPAHWSSALQGDIVVSTTTTVTDTSSAGTSSVTSALDIAVIVTSVADKPNSKSIVVTGREDSPYVLGAAVDVAGVLSETIQTRAALSLLAMFSFYVGRGGLMESSVYQYLSDEFRSLVPI